MDDTRHVIEDLNVRLDALVAQNGERLDPPEAFAALLSADTTTPEPSEQFVRELRATLLSAPHPRASTRRNWHIGIVALPAPDAAPGAWLVPAAAAFALLLVLFAAGPNWSGDGRHGFGVATAQASSTVEPSVPTPTVTPDSWPIEPAESGRDAG